MRKINTLANILCFGTREPEVQIPSPRTMVGFSRPLEDQEERFL
jgi:hypothetical protein